MNIKLPYQYIIAILLLAISPQLLYCQNKEVPEILDTVVAMPQDQNESETVMDDETVEEESYPIDTAIVSNIKRVNIDSLKILKTDKDFYYQYTLDSLLRNYKPQQQPKQPKKLPTLGWLEELFHIIKIFFWIVVLSLILFIINKIFGINGNSLFVRSNQKNISTAITEEEKEIDPDAYDALIQKAAAEENFRLATRYLFLQSLNELSKKQYIELGTEKTNYQYINETRKRSSTLSRTFAALVLKYEYIWYGEYEIANTAYFRLEEDFKTFNHQL